MAASIGARIGEVARRTGLSERTLRYYEELGLVAPPPDVDSLAARARDAGAVLDRAPEDSPPVGRVAVFRDPFGHRWSLNQPG